MLATYRARGSRETHARSCFLAVRLRALADEFVLAFSDVASDAGPRSTPACAPSTTAPSPTSQTATPPSASGARSPASSPCGSRSSLGSAPFRRLGLLAQAQDAHPSSRPGGRSLIALQLTAQHWFYLYIVWFYPLVLIAMSWDTRRTDLHPKICKRPYNGALMAERQTLIPTVGRTYEETPSVDRLPAGSQESAAGSVDAAR